MFQSDDLILDPAGVQGGPVRLVLERDKATGRFWRRTRPPRKLPAAPNGQQEQSLTWTSWHLGDGYSRIAGVGIMPAVCAEGPADAFTPGMLRLPPKVTTVATTDVFLIVPQGTTLQAPTLYALGVETGTYKFYPITNNASPSVGATITTGMSTGGVQYWGNFVYFDGVAYVGHWASTGGVMALSTAGAVTHNAGWKQEWLATLAAKLYSGHANQVQATASGADPSVAANRSALLNVGNSGAWITTLVGLGRLLYINRRDNLVILDTDLNVAELVPDLAAYFEDQNGRMATQWHAGIIFPHVRGVFYYVDGVLAPVGIDRTRVNGTNIRGVIDVLTPDGEYLWAMMRADDGKTRLLRARERAGDEPVPVPIIWQEVAQWTTTALSLLEQTFPYALVVVPNLTNGTTNTPRLWFSKNGAAGYINLPKRLAAPSALTSDFGDFEASGFKILPDTDMDQPMVSKYLRSVEVDGVGLSANKTIEMLYAIDPTTVGASFTSLGTATADGRTTLNFPAGTTCRWVRLKVALATNDATATPVCLRITLNYVERLPKHSIWQARARVGAGVADREGNEEYADQATTLALIYGWEEQAGQIAAIDPDGNAINLLILDALEEEEEQIEDQPATKRLTLWLEKVP